MARHPGTGTPSPAVNGGFRFATFPFRFWWQSHKSKKKHRPILEPSQSDVSWKSLQPRDKPAESPLCARACPWHLQTCWWTRLAGPAHVAPTGQHREQDQRADETGGTQGDPFTSSKPVRLSWLLPRANTGRGPEAPWGRLGSPSPDGRPTSEGWPGGPCRRHGSKEMGCFQVAADELMPVQLGGVGGSGRLDVQPCETAKQAGRGVQARTAASPTRAGQGTAARVR